MPAKREAVLFGPIVFWASFFSFAVSMLYAIKDLVELTDGPAKFYTVGLTFFLYLYLIRIYCGVLFMSYDESINEVLNRAGYSKRVLCYSFQFIETLLILTAPVVFSAYQLGGGYLILGLESLILTAFWVFYYKEFLFQDKDRFGNWITLILDVTALAPFALLFLGTTLDRNLLLGVMIGFSFIYIVIFILEFWYVYRRSWKSFWDYTRPLLSADGIPTDFTKPSI